MAYDFDASDIHLVYAEAREMLPAARALWRRHLEATVGHPPRRVLDLGCGTGRYSEFVREAFPRASVVGLDPALGMLSQAAVRAPDPAPLLVRGVGESLPFAEARFDLVVIALALHHLKDPEHALGEVRRVLRPSGLAYVRTPTREILGSCFWASCFPGAQALARASVPTRAEVRRFGAAGGLALDAQETLRSAFGAGPADYLARIGRRGISCLRQIPSADFEAGLRRLAERCRELPDEHVFEEDQDVFVFRRA